MSISPVTAPLFEARSGLSVGSKVVAAALIAAIAAYALLLTIFVLPGNVDSSWLIVAADRLLAGERLHVDLIETNPPFSIWLYMPFVMLEHATGIAAEVWLGIGLAAAALASVLLSARILASADPFYRNQRFVWLIPAAYFAVLILYPDQFGQREQFALVAILPWLALLCARDRDPAFRAGSWPEKIIAGIGAAIVVMIKPPYYVMAIALPSCVMAIRRRSFRPLFVAENMIGAAISAIYVVDLVAFHWAYFELLRNLFGPIYLPLRVPMLALLPQPAALALMAAIAIIAARGAGLLHRDVKLIFLTASGFVPAFVIMGKAWPNHSMPFMVLGLLALALQMSRPESLAALPSLRKAGTVLGVVFAAFLFAMSQLRVQVELKSWSAEKNRSAIAAIRHAKDDPTVVSIAAKPQSAHPLVRLIGGRYVSRNPSAWAIFNAELLIESEEDPVRKRQIETLRDSFIADMAAELAAKQADIVIYDDRPGDFWPHLILGNPAIAAVLSKYRVLYRHGPTIYFIRSDIASRADPTTGRQALAMP